MQTPPSNKHTRMANKPKSGGVTSGEESERLIGTRISAEMTAAKRPPNNRSFKVITVKKMDGKTNIVKRGTLKAGTPGAKVATKKMTTMATVPSAINIKPVLSNVFFILL